MATAEQKKRLEEALDRFRLSADAYASQVQREIAAKKFEALDQWPDYIKTQRAGSPPGTPGAVAARPCLTISQLEQPLAIVQNAQKAARLAIKITPKGDGASKDTAQVFQGLIRNIEVESRAQLARDWAFRDATICGRGFYQVHCEDANNGSFNDQDIVIKRILNSHSVYLDPFAKEPDWSDMEFVLVTEDIPLVTFKARYKDKKTKIAKMDDRALEQLAAQTSFLSSQGDTIPGWVSMNKQGWSVRVANYWYVSYEPRTLLLYTDGTGEQVGWQDEVGEIPKEQIVDSRTVQDRRVDCCLITCTDILDETEWDGRYIPIIPVIGKEHNVGGIRMWDGIVNESAQDAQRIINYMNSSQVESVGIGTRAPFVLDPKQIEGYETFWAQSNTRTLPYLPRHSFAQNGNPYPPIERNEAEPPIQSISVALGQAMQNLHYITGIPPAALGNIDSAHRSGEAINALKQSSELGTSAYTDNLAQMSLTLEGKILLDLIPAKYDRPGRIAQILGLDDKPEEVMLNQPFVKTPQGVQIAPAGTPNAIHHQLDKGRYGIAVEVGKQYTTRHQEVNAALGNIMEVYPAAAPVIAPQFVRNLDFPGSSTTADMLQALVPPQAQMTMHSGTPLPPAIQAMIQQGQAKIQQLEQAIATKQPELQVELQKTQMECASKERIAALTQQTQAGIAESKLNVQVADTILRAEAEKIGKILDEKITLLKTHADLITTAAQMQADRHGRAHDAAHDVALSAMEHGQAKDLAAQAHQQTMQAAQQAAALAPTSVAQGDGGE